VQLGSRCPVGAVARQKKPRTGFRRRNDLVAFAEHFDEFPAELVSNDLAVFRRHRSELRVGAAIDRCLIDDEFRIASEVYGRVAVLEWFVAVFDGTKQRCRRELLIGDRSRRRAAGQDQRADEERGFSRKARASRAKPSASA
jgi:hypothetical protein